MRQRRRNVRCTLRGDQLERRNMLTNWGLEAIDAPDVWSQGYHGQGAIVAVIDSGVDPHAELMPSIWRNPNEQLNDRDDDHNGFPDDLNGWNFVDDDNSPIGSTSHGTHVAGTIVASRNRTGTTGVAYEAKIMPLRIFDEAGVGSTSDIASAVRYAVDNGANVINLSIGGTATRNVMAALEYAADHNVLVVAASGNEGAKTPTFPAVSSVELPNVISVGAHDQSFTLTPTSNRVGSTGAVQIDAPGQDIMSTTVGNDYAYSSGTSAAAAHVAGVAALAISANPNVSAASLRDALVAGVSRSVIGSDSRGAVNAYRTVKIIRASTKTSNANPAADFDKSGDISFRDFVVLAQNFGSNQTSRAFGDADGDGKVAFSDFLILVQSYVQDASASRRIRGASPISEVSDVRTEPASGQQVDAVMQEDEVEWDRPLDSLSPQVSRRVRSIRDPVGS